MGAPDCSQVEDAVGEALPPASWTIGTGQNKECAVVPIFIARRNIPVHQFPIPPRVFKLRVIEVQKEVPLLLFHLSFEEKNRVIWGAVAIVGDNYA
jgi:hypothetical protein